MDALVTAVAATQAAWVIKNAPPDVSGIGPATDSEILDSVGAAAHIHELDAGTLRALAIRAETLASYAQPRDGRDLGIEHESEDTDELQERGTLVVDLDVAARAAEALRLAASLVAATQDDSLGTPVDAFGAEPIEVSRTGTLDYRAMRHLARYWELGSRSVWYRTTMELDGDVLSEIRDRNGSSALERAHIAVVEAAMVHWQILVLGLGVLIQALGGPLLRPRSLTLPKRRSLKPALNEALRGWTNAPMGVVAPGFAELTKRAWRLFALGRVVFEAPGRGNAAEVRTVIHPGGDIELSVRSAGISDDVLTEHVRAVTHWLAEIAVGFERMRRWVTLASAAPGLLFALTWTFDPVPSLRWMLLLASGATLSTLARWSARRYLRRRVLALFGNIQDGVEVPARMR